MAEILLGIVWSLVLTAPATLLLIGLLAGTGGYFLGTSGALIGAAVGAGLGLIIDVRFLARGEGRRSAKAAPGWRAAVTVASVSLIIIAALALMLR